MSDPMSAPVAATGSPPPVILVDELDQPIGLAEKLAAHESGALHRAVSVFAFDPSGRLLLQCRAHGKYHSGGLWSNTACTHPREGESPTLAAERCMREEMGLDCDRLEPAGWFIYRAQVSPSLVEHELDHLFLAWVSAAPAPNRDEVSAWRAVPLDELAGELAANPERFTAWFPLALAQLRAQPALSRLSSARPIEARSHATRPATRADG